MGLRVTAAQAAWLVDHGERMVRWHIQTRKDLPAVKDGRSWAIDVDALEAIPGWRINRERLAELQAADARTAASMAARLAELERQMRDLQRQVREMRASQSGQSGPPSTHGHDLPAVPLSDDLGHPARSDLALSASGDVLPSHAGLSPDARHILSYPAARAVTLADRGAGGPLRFKTKTDAARWLGRHGIKELTPKSWPGWPPDELTPPAALAFALGVWREARARGDWRVSWSLRRCTDATCVCQDMLED